MHAEAQRLMDAINQSSRRLQLHEQIEGVEMGDNKNKMEELALLRFRLAAIGGITITKVGTYDGRQPVNYQRIFRVLLRTRYLRGEASAFRYY